MVQSPCCRWAHRALCAHVVLPSLFPSPSPLSLLPPPPLLPLPSLSAFGLCCPCGGGGVGAAEVAGSEAVPALPERGPPGPEPPEVEGGTKAAGNELLLGARARLQLGLG